MVTLNKMRGHFEDLCNNNHEVTDALRIFRIFIEEKEKVICESHAPLVRIGDFVPSQISK